MWSYEVNHTFLERLAHDADLLTAIREAFETQGIRMGFFQVIGAVKQAHIAFYDQKDRVYRGLNVQEAGEILSCTGNVSELDGALLVHAHIILGLADGTTRGGHLVQGTRIFAGELFGMALKGEQLRRAYDEVTGLKLWPSNPETP